MRRSKAAVAVVLLWPATACSSDNPEDSNDGDPVFADGGASRAGPMADGAPANVAPADGALADPSMAGAVDVTPGEGDEADACDAGNGCFLTTVGVTGECMSTTACAALGNSTSTPGYCPGPASIECCTPTPDVAENPPVPTGWQLMTQSAVTPAMTTWAVDILNDPTGYPMFSTTVMAFGSQMVLARVEWHPPDFQNGVVHRGVTLYT